MKWIGVILGLAAVTLGVLLVIDSARHQCDVHRRFQSRFLSRFPCSYRDREIRLHLRGIASAQDEFRSRRGAYWRKDVAGLYCLSETIDGRRAGIKLIPLQTAVADDEPATPLEEYDRPRSGSIENYHLRAIRHEDEKEPDPQRFAICAYERPEAGDGRWVSYNYIIDERSVIYRLASLCQGGIREFPDDEELRRNWEKLDP